MKRRRVRQESVLAERTYRIGEAARLLDLESFVLRFWETVFPELRPVRTPKGQRLYTEADLTLLRRIQFLLYEQGMTIEGARRMLDATATAQEEEVDATKALRDALSGVAQELLTLKKLLETSSCSKTL
ncbi:MAG: MerR family transcriptional regulator [Bilophila sp.]